MSLNVRNLSDLAAGEELTADLLIVGGGAAGLSIAHEFIGSGIDVIIAESGDRQQTDRHETLNAVDFDPAGLPPEWISRRNEYHGHQAEKWRGDVQRFGVRCRGLGGSTAAWAGKSAPFAEHDYLRRDWLGYSGWPFSKADLEPFIRRAEARLNLGVGSYDDSFWDRYQGKGRRPDLDPEIFSSFLWQFARSRLNPVNMLRMGPEFLQETAANIRVLLNATATEVRPRGADGRVSVDVTGFDAKPATIRARKVVIACGALENARLLLASTSVCPAGLGNDRDQVGRYLMDHLNAPVVKFDDRDVRAVCEQFGFFGLQSGGRVDMYMHGIGLNLGVQAEEGLVNAGAFCVAERAADDPWSALAGILRGKSENLVRDAFAIAKAPGMMITGAGRLFLQSDRVPAGLRNGVVNMMVRLMPNFVVEEYQTQGVPHKLVSAGFDAVVEQEPLPENRVTLSDRTNALGQRLPRVEWRPGERPLRTLMRMGELMAQEFPKAGLPAPQPAPWILENAPQDAPIIDIAHTSGTTRMSDDAATGAVDADCKLRHCDGVYLAGGSVLPTCSHTNPTLQIVSVAIRLADHLKAEFKAGR